MAPVLFVLALSGAQTQSAFAQATNSTNTPQSSHLLTYQNPGGFKIEYPSFWQKFENNRGDSSAVYFVEPLSGVRFTVANFRISQTSLLNEPKNLILSTYLNGFTQSFQPYNITQSNSTTASGNPAIKEQLTCMLASQLELQF